MALFAHSLGIRRETPHLSTEFRKQDKSYKSYTSLESLPVIIESSSSSSIICDKNEAQEVPDKSYPTIATSRNPLTVTCNQVVSDGSHRVESEKISLERSYNGLDRDGSSYPRCFIYDSPSWIPREICPEESYTHTALGSNESPKVACFICDIPSHIPREIYSDEYENHATSYSEDTDVTLFEETTQGSSGSLEVLRVAGHPLTPILEVTEDPAPLNSAVSHCYSEDYIPNPAYGSKYAAWASMHVKTIDKARAVTSTKRILDGSARTTSSISTVKKSISSKANGTDDGFWDSFLASSHSSTTTITDVRPASVALSSTTEEYPDFPVCVEDDSMDEIEPEPARKEKKTHRSGRKHRERLEWLQISLCGETLKDEWPFVEWRLKKLARRVDALSPEA